jgi:hypothetical protein
MRRPPRCGRGCAARPTCPCTGSVSGCRPIPILEPSSPGGPTCPTEPTLRTIARHPEVRAGDLATALGRDRHSFKIDVRKLKNLGLTLSYPIGYRLSPRGEAYLAHRDGRPPPHS